MLVRRPPDPGAGRRPGGRGVRRPARRRAAGVLVDRGPRRRRARPVGPAVACSGARPARSAPTSRCWWPTRRRRCRPIPRCGWSGPTRSTCCSRPRWRCTPRRSASRRWSTTAVAGYRRRVADLVRARRAYARIVDREVVFKAELAVVTRHTAQVQGVWVAPRWRGRGLAAPAMAAVVRDALRRVAPSVSLYVNDYNTPARRVYARCGFRPGGYVRHGAVLTCLRATQPAKSLLRAQIVQKPVCSAEAIRDPRPLWHATRRPDNRTLAGSGGDWRTGGRGRHTQLRSAGVGRRRIVAPGSRTMAVGRSPARPSLSVRLAPGVALRDEPFGAMAYVAERDDFFALDAAHAAVARMRDRPSRLRGRPVERCPRRGRRPGPEAGRPGHLRDHSGHPAASAPRPLARRASSPGCRDSTGRWW